MFVLLIPGLLTFSTNIPLIFLHFFLPIKLICLYTGAVGEQQGLAAPPAKEGWEPSVVTRQVGSTDLPNKEPGC